MLWVRDLPIYLMNAKIHVDCVRLLVARTKVGCVPEVLPPHVILFGKPDEDDMIRTVSTAVELL